MKKSLIPLLASFFFYLVSPAQQVIYVDIANNTGYEDGTPTHPFNTILEGLQLSLNGDSLAIASGTYAEDTLVVRHCVRIAGKGRASTTLNGSFMLSSKLDTLPVLIKDLWCRNIMHNDSGYTMTPLTIRDCGLKVLDDHTAAVGETGRIRVSGCIVTDSIHIESATCAARREVIDCETGGLWISSASSQGNIRVSGNQVNGCLRVSTISKSDTVFLTENTVTDSLVLTSVASDFDVITENTVGNCLRTHAVAHSGFEISGNLIQNGSLMTTYTALSYSQIKENVILNGGINFKSVAGDIFILENQINSGGPGDGIRFLTTAGGIIGNNTVHLPYSPPSGLPFEWDTVSVCGIRVHSTSFGGMRGNTITGGAYGVYLSAVSSKDFDLNEIADAHYGVYLRSVSGSADSNRVENCIADGIILDYPPEYADTNSIRLNYNVIRNNGGHGIRTKGNCPMGRLDEPGTGFNVIKDNGGYDLYVETPATFVDTIWAQNNQWTHSTAYEAGMSDIYDAADDPSKALVMYTPLQPAGIETCSATAFRIVPNPSTGVFRITGSFAVTGSMTGTGDQIQSVELTDMSGKIVYTSGALNPLQIDSGNTKVDISNLRPGVYCISIITREQKLTQKIIKY